MPSPSLRSTQLRSKAARPPNSGCWRPWFGGLDVVAVGIGGRSVAEIDADEAEPGRFPGRWGDIDLGVVEPDEEGSIGLVDAEGGGFGFGHGGDGLVRREASFCAPAPRPRLTSPAAGAPALRSCDKMSMAIFFSVARPVRSDAKASICGLSFSFRECALMAGSMQMMSSFRSSIAVLRA